MENISISYDLRRLEVIERAKQRLGLEKRRTHMGVA
jgi:hypothetical protein